MPASPWRILFVDDDPLMGMLTQVALRRAGHDVTFATHADAALESFEAATEPYDLVICDLRLGAASGFDVAGEILRRHPGQRVALVSGHVSDADRARAQALGVAAILPKRDAMNDLPGVIARIGA